MPSFLPINMQGVKPQSGGLTYPEGFYLLEVTDAKERKPFQTTDGEAQLYKTKIHMGPGWSQEYAGKQYTDRIPVDQKWAPRHMELLAACYGGEAGANQVLAQHGFNYDPQITEGRFYIAQVVVSKGFNNVIQRIPYTQENWQQVVGDGAAAQPSGGMLQPTHPVTNVQQQAPAPPMMQMPQQGYQQMPQMPQQAYQQVPQAPQVAPQGVPPGGFPMPPMQAPQQAQGGFPVPPPPPGFPAR